MAVLNKEEFFSKIKERIGDDTSDEAMAFIEDVTDTYNDLLSKSNDSEWKEKCEALDKQWREKYKARFFESVNNTPPIQVEDADTKESSDVEDFDDLFKDKED